MGNNMSFKISAVLVIGLSLFGCGEKEKTTFDTLYGKQVSNYNKLFDYIEEQPLNIEKTFTVVDSEVNQRSKLIRVSYTRNNNINIANEIKNYKTFMVDYSNLKEFKIDTSLYPITITQDKGIRVYKSYGFEVIGHFIKKEIKIKTYDSKSKKMKEEIEFTKVFLASGIKKVLVDTRFIRL
jgi:hypothetical protein